MSERDFQMFVCPPRATAVITWPHCHMIMRKSSVCAGHTVLRSWVAWFDTLRQFLHLRTEEQAGKWQRQNFIRWTRNTLKNESPFTDLDESQHRYIILISIHCHSRISQAPQAYTILHYTTLHCTKSGVFGCVRVVENVEIFDCIQVI